MVYCKNINAAIIYGKLLILMLMTYVSPCGCLPLFIPEAHTCRCTHTEVEKGPQEQRKSQLWDKAGAETTYGVHTQATKIKMNIKKKKTCPPLIFSSAYRATFKRSCSWAVGPFTQTGVIPAKILGLTGNIGEENANRR